MSKKLAEELHEAHYVNHFEEAGVIFVWHGGHTVNVYDYEANLVDDFSVGEFHRYCPLFQTVTARIREQKKQYLEEM